LSAQPGLRGLTFFHRLMEGVPMTGSKTVVVIGPLAAHAVEFDVRLAALGYARSARTDVQVAAAELSGWLAGSGLPMAGCLTTSSRSSVGLPCPRRCVSSSGPDPPGDDCCGRPEC